MKEGYSSAMNKQHQPPWHCQVVGQVAATFTEMPCNQPRPDAVRCNSGRRTKKLDRSCPTTSTRTRREGTKEWDCKSSLEQFRSRRIEPAAMIAAFWSGRFAGSHQE